MTKEKTKVKTFDILHFVADNAGLSTFEAIEKAYNMGVSKQKSVLDKIRAEIEKWHKEGTNWSDIRLMEIEDILNKYKAESEE